MALKVTYQEYFTALYNDLRVVAVRTNSSDQVYFIRVFTYSNHTDDEETENDPDCV
jgi:hypothetical protein